jgi:hypothetical protein
LTLYANPWFFVAVKKSFRERRHLRADRVNPFRPQSQRVLLAYPFKGRDPAAVGFNLADATPAVTAAILRQQVFAPV